MLIGYDETVKVQWGNKSLLVQGAWGEIQGVSHSEIMVLLQLLVPNLVT